jgi:hypothetical protein
VLHERNEQQHRTEQHSNSTMDANEGKEGQQLLIQDVDERL